MSRRKASSLARLWRLLELGVWRVRRWVRRRQRQVEAQLYEIGREMWNLVDEFPQLGERVPIIPIRNQFYAHGAFMGAAPALLDDARWRRILAFLMPDVYSDVERAVKRQATHARIIPMFENNPVMAAFGTWKSAELRRRSRTPHAKYDLSGHEWDVFVDGDLVAEWEVAPPDQAPQFLTRIVDTMLVAHATSTDTLQEQVGLCQYVDVRRTRKTAMGGVEAPAWMDLFARALALAEAADLSAAILAMAADQRHLVGEECRDHTFVARWPFAEAARLYRQVTGRGHLSVVLEIKSLRSTPRLVQAIVDELNGRGVHVSAVGSFSLHEIRGLSEHTQRVGDEILAGPSEILFFHTAGDLQAACDAGKVETGQHALFNGASLLEPEGGAYRADARLIAELDRYRVAHELQLGFYVQEGDCDAAAAAALSAVTATYTETFALGFAWGGLQDEAAVLAEGRDRRGFGSQAMLLKLGVAKRWRYPEA
jgi:hypothetical protein